MTNTVNGTAGNDYIHVHGDGHMPVHGSLENDTATDGDDIINSGNGGTDMIFAGGGADTINFGSDLDSSDIINGGDGNDTLVLNGQNTVTFGANSLVSIEKMLLPFIVLQPHFAGTQSLTMNDGNLAAGITMHVDASGIGPNTFFSIDASDEKDGRYNITGGAGDDTIIGGQATNGFFMGSGGDDYVQGGAQADDFYFGDTLTAADRVVMAGGDGLEIGGPSYAAGLTFAASTITATGGSLILDPVYSYKLVMNDANVAAGGYFHVQPIGADHQQTLQFDGSAETDASFDVEGFSGNDTLITGAGNDFINGYAGADKITIGAGEDYANGDDGNDTIVAGEHFDAGDHIDGGADIDTLTLAGAYAPGVVFTATTVVNVERIVLGAQHNYNLTTNDATVAAGEKLTVDGSAIIAGHYVIFNGAAETDGAFVIKGGAGDDTLTGGAGADTITGGLGKDIIDGGAGADVFVYHNAANSTGSGYDVIQHADFKTDRWDVPGKIVKIDTAITHGSLSGGAKFDALLTKDVSASLLGAHDAVLFTANGGSLSGKTFLVIDVNGTAGYQAGADLVIKLADALHLNNIGLHDFI